MAYTPLSTVNPVGTQTGSAVPDSARTNDLALRDAIIMGAVDGYVFSVSGGTAPQPAFMFWKNGTIWLRASITWGSGTGTDGNPTTIVWDLSINSGTDYTTAPGGAIDTQTFTFDTSGNLTATTGSGGFLSWLVGLLGKVKTLLANFNAHTAATGTAVHGLGTMATQAASGVAITGGTAVLTTEREAVTALGNVSASTAINWALGGMVSATITAAGGTFTHSNLPNGVVGYMLLEVTNAGVATTLLSGVKWPGGVVPSWTAAGKDIVTLKCSDGATVYGSMLKDCK